jgi:putative hydrolase of the HAD superfamily
VPIRALIFDLDETLLADALSTQAALVATIEGARLGQDVDAREVAQAVRRHAERLWERGPAHDYAEAIGISACEGLWGTFAGDHPELQRLAAWAAEYHRGVWSAALGEHGIADDALADRLAARFREERLARQLLFPDVLPALDRLRADYRLAILTNGAPDIQRAKIDGSGLSPYFELIVVSGEIGAGKPDPRSYEHTLTQLSLPAADAVMIGDNLANDVRGAQQAGLRAIWIDRHGGALCELRRTAERLAHRVSPDATIASLDKLPATL